jgi:hypothetical protein
VVGDPYLGVSPLEFVLRYKGPLHANSNAKEKHAIRQLFHPQLKNLWQTHPLLAGTTSIELVGRSEERWVKETRVDWISESHRRGAYRFVPLVSKDLNLICGLDIQFLRRESPGMLIRGGGDIDNRVKTLFDALRIPDENQIEKMSPELDEEPFYCLLEDDALITGFCITTERLLDPLAEGEPPSHIALHIKAKVYTTLASETAAFDKLKPQ